METISQILARELDRPQSHIDNVIALLDEGNTIPFIARYRKELHGAMDDTSLRTLAERMEYLRGLQQRRETVKKAIEEQGKLTEDLSQAIDEAETLAALEDLYRPYKQKRRTRATVAKEKGLEPLAQLLFQQGRDLPAPEKLAKDYVNPEKGVETVFEVVDRLNAAGSGEVTVDFYGQVEADYEERFQELLGRCPHAVFKGSLEPGKVVETLAGYDLLLLPTFYPGEGFPGAIVEAGLAGIPVAVSLWKHNIEYVKDGETGFLIPLGPGETDAYADCIRKLRTDRDLLLSMRKKAYQESRQYTAEAVWPVLRPYVEGGSQGH